MPFQVIRSFNDSVLPDPEKVFVSTSESSFDVNPLWEEIAAKYTQLDLFAEKAREIPISMTDFWMAMMCPKMFKGYFLTDELKRGSPKHYGNFEIGGRIDKIVKDYFTDISLGLSIGDAREKSYEKFEQALKNLKKLKLSEKEIEGYLNALLDFFDAFKNFELVESRTNKVEFTVNRIKFRGDYDLLLRNKVNGKKVLLDLKLKKFGNAMGTFEFYEFIQVILYYIGLKRSGVDVSYIGYYFFVERTFVIDSKILNQDLEKYVERLVERILALPEFRPKKCFLCLICGLKRNCKVGRPLRETDFSVPLVPEENE